MIAPAHIAILGAGGYARETYWHLKDCFPNAAMVFVDDVTDITELQMAGVTVPVVKDWRFQLPAGGAVAHFVAGVGDPRVKRILVEKARQAGLAPLPTVVHPRALVQAPDCVLGTGGMIAPGCILTTNVRLGDFVILNLGTTIGHDSVLGDYVTCAPGCSISGNVVLGDEVSLGTGTAIREKIHIAPRVVTGAQSCVVKHITQPGITVAGVPAKPLHPPESAPHGDAS